MGRRRDHTGEPRAGALGVALAPRAGYSKPLAWRSLPSILQGSHGGPFALPKPALAPRRDGQPAARRGDGQALGAAAGRGDDSAVCRRRDLRQDRRERARPGRLHHSPPQPPAPEPPAFLFPLPPAPPARTPPPPPR